VNESMIEDEVSVIHDVIPDEKKPFE